MLISRTAVVVFMTTLSVVAQQRPNFSGDYVLNLQASTLSPVLAGVESATLRIDHQDPVFKYRLTMLANGKPSEMGFDLTSDGREVKETRAGRETVISLSWDGDALVFHGRSVGTIEFRYELLDGGRRLRATEQIRGSREQDNIWIFDRK